MSSSQSSKNALTHGFYASDVVLSWENQQEFDALLQAFRDEYRPDGASEEATVFDLASLHWKKRRLNVGSQLAFHKHSDAGGMATASSEGWKGVADYLAIGDGDRMADEMRAVAKAQTKAAQHVCDSICKHMERILKPDDAAAESNVGQAIDFEKMTTMAKELNLISKSLIVPVLHAIENQNLDQKVAERAYRPDIMEKELKIHAEIDRRIEKAIRRLVMVKEYKRQYCAKSANANQIEATALTAK